MHPKVSYHPDSPIPHDGRRALGTLGEDLAADHFRRLGFAVVERNIRTRHGEIDLIAFDGTVLVFVEIKTRRVRNAGRGLRPQDQPLSWLGSRQRLRMRKLARAWLHDRADTRPRAATIRFDAIGVIVDGTGKLLRLDHVEGA